MFNIAILGAGSIASTMAATIRGMERGGQPVCLYAVGSRDLAKAQAFAAAEGVRRAYGSYEELVSDPDVDLVYVATPHSHHAEHTLLCIRAGKPVLCEKAFTANAAEARAVLRQAEERGVLVTEAIWTRYQPARMMIQDMIAAGDIGEPKMITANLCYPLQHVQRMWNPALAGGALLDLGVYPLNFALMVFGSDVARMESSASLLSTGVDRQNSITLHYADGRMAQLTSSMSFQGDRSGIIYGSKGAIVVDNINNPSRIELRQNVPGRGLVTTRVTYVPWQITGYEYEVQACMNALSAGLTECADMPHAETLKVMEMMDALRRSWGVVYPADERH